MHVHVGLYLSALGASLSCTDQAESQPDSKPNGALHQLQQPANETLHHYLNSNRDRLPPDGQSEPQYASHHATSLPQHSTAPVVNGMPANSHSFQIPCARPQLQPVLKHATRFSQQAHTATLPVACFSASDAVQSQNLTGSAAETCPADGTAAAVATKQSSDPHHPSANAFFAPAQVTKQRKVPAAAAKRQQQQQQRQQQQAQQAQQARAPVADECLDCQQLRLLPEDVPLHSECMVRMQHSSAEPGQASRYIQGARLADNMAQAAGANKSGAIGKPHKCWLSSCMLASVCWHLFCVESHSSVSLATVCWHLFIGTCSVIRATLKVLSWYVHCVTSLQGNSVVAK